MAGQFSAELLVLVPDWKLRLSADPGQLPSLEQEVHTAFARGADLLSAGLIALVMQQPEFAAASEQTRSGYQSASGGLTRGRERTIRVRLLGGLLLWVTSLYCAPRWPLVCVPRTPSLICGGGPSRLDHRNPTGDRRWPAEHET
jgi:hypothetical protein